MILEIALLEITPGKEAEFEQAFVKAGPLFQRAKGCRGMEIQRSIEHPSRYRLFVSWETLEDHMVGFRESEDFQGWRALVSPYFVKPPEVEHTQLAVKNF
ncbi:antibiotic biosynthesis monooxygenase family protein [Ancylobacter mangrovi]|uniref:antibiotic biosynthesis monooxygenase family protein n=1 Tax=Ancylobacter mangrovi TaxID=2972472 RepID=UPI002163C547|nr:antibiotic biosynthesis monooxygenase [Ancylobacter mangrovi]MCS0504535.1 antibiotic biosynthesis monooxygenase [Ancylobacter mangrovi]